MAPLSWRPHTAQATRGAVAKRMPARRDPRPQQDIYSGEGRAAHLAWRAGGIRRVLAELGFQLADVGLQGGILCAQSGVLPPERRHLLQQQRSLRGRQHGPVLRGRRQCRLDHAAVVAYRRRLGELAARL